MARFGRRYIPWKDRRQPSPLGTSNAIVGTCDAALTCSGTLTATGALVGACAVEIVATGTMTAGSLISGTSDMTITPSGTLVGDGALAGSCAMVITSSADNGLPVAELPPNLWFTLNKECTEYTLSRAPEFTLEQS